MFWIILIIAINIFVFYKFFKSGGFHSWKDCVAATIVVFVFVNGLLTMLSMIVALSSAGISYEERDYEISIYSLRSENEISGSFFIGTGTIGSTEHYYFFRDHGNGALIRDTVRAQSTPIIEDDSLTPHLIQRRRVISGFNSWFVHPFVYFEGEDAYIGTTKGPSGRVVRNTLVVPEGTIIQEFRLE